MFRLMLVTDRRLCREPLPQTVKRVLDAGADAVQLRERGMETDKLMRLAETLRRITAEKSASLIINHRLDIALAVEADGAHLTWRSLSVEQARELAGGKLRIGVSCHNREQLQAAAKAGADYAILGPVFPTPSKQGLIAPLGLKTFAELAADTPLPIIAIGGIKPHNAAQIRAAGAAGIAVISAILSTDDPAAATRALAKN